MNKDTRQDYFLQYGVPSDLASRAVDASLTVSKVRSVAQRELVSKFGMSTSDAKILRTSVRRKEIDQDTLHMLFERSNYTCNVCKGSKGSAFVVHHIEPYEISKDNDYSNLIVLCPNDHDLAHRGGLSRSLSKNDLRLLKKKWEYHVEHSNAQRAAQRVEVNDGAADYINIRRIEEICLRLFSDIPPTRVMHRLKHMGILNTIGTFDEKYVRANLSGAGYLFNYMNAGEMTHYRDLLQKIIDTVTIEDLAEATRRGARAVKALEGRYAFFIGGVYSKQPDFPITPSTPPISLHYTKRNIRLEWVLDPNFLMSNSAISRMGHKNRYIIYCLVGTVYRDPTSKFTIVSASPLFIAQPNSYVERTPLIKFQREALEAENAELFTEDEASPLNY